MHTIEDLEAWATVVVDDIRNQTGWVLDDFDIVIVKNRRVTQLLGQFKIGLGIRQLRLYHNTLKDWHETAIEDVIRHEVAHIVALDSYQGSGHGYWWKRLAKQVGARPFANGNEDKRLAYAATRG